MLPDDAAPLPSAQMLLRVLLGRGIAPKIAEDCGVQQSVVFEWAIGEHRPDPVSRIVLEEEFNIPRPAWNQG